MIDGLGFVEALQRSGFDARGKRAAVFGAGAVGRALLLSLTDAGVSGISFHEPDTARRAALVGLASAAGVAGQFATDALESLASADLAINASPVGMNGDPAMPFDPARLPPHAFVADVVTSPVLTPLLLAAQAAGLRTQSGIAMSDAQLAMQMRYFGFAGDRSE
jgi:shikimate dehydrogenase